MSTLQSNVQLSTGGSGAAGDARLMPNNDTSPTSSDRNKYFEKFAQSGSPFDFQADDDDCEDVMEINGVSLYF